MPRRIRSTAMPLISLALQAAMLSRSASPAPLPASARTSASPHTAIPAVAFQAVGLSEDLAVASPAQLLSAVTHVHGDAGFAPVSYINGLALSPTTGKIYVAGFDGTSSYLGEVDWNTGNETTIGKISGEVIVDLAFDGSGNLFGLTDNAAGTNQHALLSINTATAAASVAKILDSHGGSGDFEQYGGLAFNSANGSLYYADTDSNNELFIDKLAPGTLAQTSELSGGPYVPPSAMAFSQGSLWINASEWYSADAANLAAGVTELPFFSEFPTPDGSFVYHPRGIFPSTLPCTPSPTAACLANRFKVEVTYDATPSNGSGPANVVLESTESVKFTFFDPSNIEMILKVLNACSPPFNNWWVFAGGLTNVGVTIKVTDTKTGAVKNYANTKGQIFQAFADTQAFACP